MTCHDVIWIALCIHDCLKHIDSKALEIHIEPLHNLSSPLLSFLSFLSPHYFLLSNDMIFQWLSQYEGLSLTSRGQHSALPHLRIPSCLFDVTTKAPDERNGDTTVAPCENAMNDVSFRNNSSVKGAYAEKQLSAESYVRYLKMYARRYGLERHMKLGCSVVKVVQSRFFTAEGDVESQCVSGEDSHSSSSSYIHADDDSNGYYLGNPRKGNSNITISSLSSTGGKDRGRYRGRDSGLVWEVHYTYSNPSGARVAAVTHCRCVVVASGKAQLPATDPYLTDILKGYTGHTVNAKDVKDLKGVVFKLK